MRRVEVRIGRLVLDGLPIERHQAGAVREAVEAELGRLFADPDLSLAGVALGRLRGADVRLDAGGAPRALGAQVARSVHGAAVEGRR